MCRLDARSEGSCCMVRLGSGPAAKMLPRIEGPSACGCLMIDALRTAIRTDTYLIQNSLRTQLRDSLNWNLIGCAPLMSCYPLMWALSMFCMPVYKTSTLPLPILISLPSGSRRALVVRHLVMKPRLQPRQQHRKIVPSSPYQFQTFKRIARSSSQLRI